MPVRSLTYPPDIFDVLLQGATALDSTRFLHNWTLETFLCRAVPTIEKQTKKREILQGELPSPIHAPSGCVFRTRCPYATAACAEALPEWKEIAPGHKVACHLYD